MFLKQDNWCSKEFESIKLGDERLNRRFIIVASHLLNNPTEPIHVACRSWSEAKGAYRLFDNEKLKEKTILQKHQIETIKRLEKTTGLIFAIQDTTILNYTHHPKKKGINKINKNPGFDRPSRGCFLHNTFLMTEKGLPLGLIDQQIFQHNSTQVTDHKRRPITEKQSFKWIESLRTTISLCQQKQVVTISDRESDIFEFLAEAQELKAKVLVRATKDRRLLTNRRDSTTLWAHMKTIPLKGIKTIFLPAHQNNPERQATLEVRYGEVTLKPPQRYPEAKQESLSYVTMQVVWLYESDPPEGIERLEWMLLTNLSVKSAADAIQIGEWYRLRWQIECYHRILKSGCKVEECRLETYERLKKYLRLKSIIAIRLFWLTWINRTNPEASSEEVLEEHEWKALYYFLRKEKPPIKPPSVKETVRMIAKLGGFLGRKNDGEPGMTYIWRGWEKLTLIAEVFLSTRLEDTCG